MPGPGGDFINAWGVHQLDPAELWHLDPPGFTLLAAGAAVGHIRGEDRLLQQGIERLDLPTPTRPKTATRSRRSLRASSC